MPGQRESPEPDEKLQATVLKMSKGKGRPRQSRKNKPRRYEDNPETQPAVRWKRGKTDRPLVHNVAEVLKPTAARDRRFGRNVQKELEDDPEMVGKVSDLVALLLATACAKIACSPSMEAATWCRMCRRS